MKNKLTGKCKKEFLKHCKQSELFMDTYADIYLNALIIEFFDSVGIWKNTFNNFYVKYFRNEMTLTEATNAAIEKANSIYNESKL